MLSVRQLHPSVCLALLCVLIVWHPQAHKAQMGNRTQQTRTIQTSAIYFHDVCRTIQPVEPSGRGAQRPQSTVL